MSSFYSAKALHRMEVVSAAYSYANVPSINLRTLANSFKVNVATILTWIDEALKLKLIDEPAKKDCINEKMKEDLKHQQNVTAVALTYAKTDANLKRLANNYNVSEAVISEWLVEAVEQGYVNGDKDINSLIAKHVNEYEKRHHLMNSSLRTTYKSLQLAVKYRNEQQGLAG